MSVSFMYKGSSTKVDAEKVGPRVSVRGVRFGPSARNQFEIRRRTFLEFAACGFRNVRPGSALPPKAASGHRDTSTDAPGPSFLVAFRPVVCTPERSAEEAGDTRAVLLGGRAKVDVATHGG